MTHQTDRFKSLLQEPDEVTVVLVGAGNVAWHLGLALTRDVANVRVLQVYSRTFAPAQELAGRIPFCIATTSLDFSGSCADLFLIAVPDHALEEVVQQASFPSQAVVAHTSGSQGLQVLSKKVGNRAGVMYPLQTFTKGAEVALRSVPLLLEGSPESYPLLHEVASRLSANVSAADSAQRLGLHLAAVFACNFTNHLLGISRELLLQAGLSHHLLHPLIHETWVKATRHDPFEVQTGPAIRGDRNVIDRHLYMLRHLPQYQEVYDVLTRSIEQKRPGAVAGNSGPAGDGPV